MTKRKRTKKRKLWSVPRIAHPQFSDYMLRVTELVKGGDLYVVRMVDGKQRMALLRPRCTRLDLGSDEREQKQSACARAFEIIEALAESKEDADAEATEAGAPLTLAALAELYEVHGLHGVGASYRRDQVAKLRRFSAFLGGERRVISLCKSDIRKFEAHRLKGGVRRSTVHGDLDALKIACTWAAEHKRVDGQPLLDRNPLAKVRVQRDTPRRPWCTPERYERLLGVADQLPPAFGVVLSVAWESGRRLGAILRLNWRDVDFEGSEKHPHGAIRWDAGRTGSNKAHEQVIPMNLPARQALQRWRLYCGATLWQLMAERRTYGSRARQMRQGSVAPGARFLAAQWTSS